jgi:glycosyltransferase involved in cell wall biosynthesis
MTQILFPGKKKTAKYAGNWDPHSGQPFTYRLQRRILNNEFLTRNMQVMVYGNWPDSSARNTAPFFTASYTESQKFILIPRIPRASETVRLIFTGALLASKRPLLSVQIADQLVQTGIAVQLDIFGNGEMRQELENYIGAHNLGSVVTLHGNRPAQELISYYQQAHFLIFLSKTEGWPKVVAEAMWWGCLPVTTAVSCVPEMLGNGTRGSVIGADKDEAVKRIRYYLDHATEYATQVTEASAWAQQFTLEKFEEAITRLLEYDEGTQRHPGTACD